MIARAREIAGKSGDVYTRIAVSIEEGQVLAALAKYTEAKKILEGSLGTCRIGTGSF